MLILLLIQWHLILFNDKLLTDDEGLRKLSESYHTESESDSEATSRAVKDKGLKTLAFECKNALSVDQCILNIERSKRRYDQKRLQKNKKSLKEKKKNELKFWIKSH